MNRNRHESMWQGADPATQAILGQAGGVITKRQVRDLILAARQAYLVQQRGGLADEPFDVWRKGGLQDACGRQSFRDVRQGEYGEVLRYFLMYAERPVAQRRAAAQGQARDEARRARWALERECEKLAPAFGSREGALAYAGALLGRIHKTCLEEATARQCWQVLFTMRNRARAKTRQKPL